jgi:hypothetical protein
VSTVARQARQKKAGPNLTTYNPDTWEVLLPVFPEIDRAKILLPVNDKVTVRSAHKLAMAIGREWRAARVIYQENKSKWGKKLIRQYQSLVNKDHDQYMLLRRVFTAKKATEQGLSIKARTTEFKRFYRTAVVTARRIGINPTQDTVDLAALFSTKGYQGKFSVLTKLPNHFFNLSMDEGREIAGLLLRCFFEQKLKVKTARDLELKKGFSKELIASGLSSLTKGLSPIGLIETAYPGITHGRDPVIRPWLIQQGTKWQGDTGLELTKRACAWLLEYGEKIYNRKDETFDIEKIKSINWSEVIERHGLRKMLELSPALHDSLDVISLGAITLGKKNLIGIKEWQLKPWEVRRLGMWREYKSNCRRLIDQVTAYAVGKVLREKAPHMFMRSGKGVLIADEVKKYKAWSELFNGVACDCLRNSGLKIHQALSRVYPEIFGWSENQITFYDLPSTGKWIGKKGTKNFREGFARAIYRYGLGKFRSDTGTYSFNMQDFIRWEKQMHMSGLNFIDIVRLQGLSGGLKYSAAKDKISRAIDILFERSPGSGPKTNRRENMTLFRGYLLEAGGEFSISVNQPRPSVVRKRLAEVRRREAMEEKRQARLTLAEKQAEIKKLIFERTNLMKIKDKDKVNALTQLVSSGDPIAISALKGIPLEMPHYLRPNVYTLRQKYKFRALFMSIDSSVTANLD